MKHEILDVPFRDSFQDFLEKGETIIWRGQPTQNLPFTGGIALTFVLLFLTMIYNWNIFGFWNIPVIITLALLHGFATQWKNKRKDKVRYAITQKQILFQFKKAGEYHVYNIPFSDISKITFSESKNEFHRIFKNDIGVIFLFLENPATVSFSTYRFDFRRKRPQPTLELIDDVEEVAQLINQGIGNVNPSLSKNKTIEVSFRASFEAFLEKGETILWQDSPVENSNSLYKFDKNGKLRYEFKDLFLAAILFLTFLVTAIFVGSVIVLLVVIGVIALFIFRMNQQKKKLHPTKYAITQKRILFQLTHLPKNQIHQILFSNISDLEVQERYQNVGTIFLKIRQPHLLDFSTYSMKRSDGNIISTADVMDAEIDNDGLEKRPQPTLEVIQDVDRIAELIQAGIKNVNTLA